MKQKITLTVTSLLTLLFMTFHLTDDILRQLAPGGLMNYVLVLVMALWLWGTLVLVERRSGHIIILVLSLFSSGIPVLHMMGSGLGGSRIVNSSGAFFFVWTLLAIGATSLFSVILSTRRLWSLQRGQSR